MGCSTQSTNKEDALLALGDDLISAEFEENEFNEEIDGLEADFSLEIGEDQDSSEVASNDSFGDLDDSDFLNDENDFQFEETSSEQFAADDFSEFDEIESDEAQDQFADFEEDESGIDFADNDANDFFVEESTADTDDMFGSEFSSVVSGTIENIEFFAEKGGVIVIKGTEALDYSSRFEAGRQQVILDFENVVLPKSLQRPFILKDFPQSAFSSINATQKAGSSRAKVVIQMKNGENAPIVKSEQNQIILSPETTPLIIAGSATKPPSQDPSSGQIVKSDSPQILGATSLNEFLMGNTKFYGKPISIQVKDADIREVLNFIADESGANLIVSEEVEGKVSLKLRQVPWDQALVTVLRANQLGYLRNGNVIQVSKLERLKAENEVVASMQTVQTAQAPLKVKVMPLSFGKVEELVTTLKPLLTPERGSVVADLRTNSLILTDTSETIIRLTALVKELDVAPAQVLIEGKVVEAGEDFISNVGINWGFNGGTLEAGGRILSPSFTQAPMDPFTLEAKNTILNLRMGTFDFFGDLTASLALAERDSMVKIISSPRIVTMNKEKAKIKTQGENVTINTIVDITGLRTAQVQRDPIEVSLEVTPQVTNDGNVILELKVLRQFAGALVNEETQARPISTREAETKILVRNGQTAVIGGMYQSDETSTSIGTPFLKDIPIIGWLFKEKRRDLIKNELLIFITPRILNYQNEQPIASLKFDED